jgi:hypothetical protein
MLSLRVLCFSVLRRWPSYGVVTLNYLHVKPLMSQGLVRVEPFLRDLTHQPRDEIFGLLGDRFEFGQIEPYIVVLDVLDEIV